MGKRHYKIGIYGYFAFDIADFGGQPVKTRAMFASLLNFYRKSDILILDSIGWKKTKIKHFFRLLNLIFRCKNIILLPARNGVNIVTKIVYIVSRLFCLKRIIHYVVIGGWLNEAQKDNHSLAKILKKIDYIYVETETMKQNLLVSGFSNVVLMRNFKNAQPLLKEYNNEAFDFCFFSRVIEQKGIIDAVDAISRVNAKSRNHLCTLDIYGPASETFINEILNRHKADYIKYKGLINTQDSTSVLNNYYMQIFPTKFYTEGVPGSLVDSFFAGLPIIASRWESSGDVVKDGYNGILFSFNRVDDLVDKIEYSITHRNLINAMRINCVETSQLYDSKKAIQPLLERIL